MCQFTHALIGSPTTLCFKLIRFVLAFGLEPANDYDEPVFDQLRTTLKRYLVSTHIFSAHTSAIARPFSASKTISRAHRVGDHTIYEPPNHDLALSISAHDPSRLRHAYTHLYQWSSNLIHIESVALVLMLAHMLMIGDPTSCFFLDSIDTLHSIPYATFTFSSLESRV